jgi:hypothetical protein
MMNSTELLGRERLHLASGNLRNEPGGIVRNILIMKICDESSSFLMLSCRVNGPVAEITES